MTRLGKIGLFLNVALACVFAVWGFGLYSNRINWKEQSDARAKELKSLSDARNKVFEQLEPLPALVQAEEERLPKLQAWEEKQLQDLLTGPESLKPKQLAYKDGKVVLDPKTGFPELEDITNSANQPVPGVASLEVLNKRQAQLHAQIKQVISDTTALVEQEKKLTVQINGGPGEKGLRATLEEERAKERKSLDRQEYLKPLLYNRLPELEILNRRRQGLEGRLKELQGSKVALQ